MEIKKYQLIKCSGTIYRILAVEDREVLLIDCMKKTMPKWYRLDEVSGYEDCTENELMKITGNSAGRGEGYVP